MAGAGGVFLIGGCSGVESTESYRCQTKEVYLGDGIFMNSRWRDLVKPRFAFQHNPGLDQRRTGSSP
jgi:hypothetical protein